MRFGLRLFLRLRLHFWFFFFYQKHVNTAASGSRALCTGPTALSTSTHCPAMALSVGPVYCSRDPQISLFSNFFIKNEFHSTIHTFKNYFAKVFLVFNFQFSVSVIISSIQTDLTNTIKVFDLEGRIEFTRWRVTIYSALWVIKLYFLNDTLSMFGCVVSKILFNLCKFS